MKKEILIGRHISFSKPDYLLGSAKLAFYKYKCNSFMIYLGSPRSSFRVKYEDLKINEFKNFLEEKSLDTKNVVVHASYFINLCNFDSEEKLNFSINILRSDLKLMDKIGLKTIVVHPGSSLNLDRNKCLLSIAKCLDKILSDFPNINVALETMSGSGNQVGKNFEELEFIINNSNRSNQIGVCFDTCHLYSYGYDIKNNFDLILSEFKEKIGIEKLFVIHLNDSEHPLSSKKDRHSNIGFGFLGLEAISRIAHHQDLIGVIKILETPVENVFHEKEIDLIKKTIF